MKKKKCPVCGGKLIDGATLCLHCLEPLTEKTAVLSARVPGRRMRSALAASSVLFAAALVVIVLLFGASAKGSEPAVTDGITASVSVSKSASSAARTTRKTVTSGTDATDTGAADSKETEAESRKDETPSEDMTEPEATPQTETDRSAPRAASDGTTAARTTAPGTTARAESGTVHVHTPDCYTKVIDVPYRAAVYYTEDVYEGGNNVTVTTYYVSLYDIGREDVTVYSFNFGSEPEYLEWRNGNASNMGEYFDGERTVSYIVYEGKMYEYGVWTHEETGHGPVLLHRSGDLKEPEVKEVSHYELTCGYE